VVDESRESKVSCGEAKRERVDLEVADLIFGDLCTLGGEVG